MTCADFLDQSLSPRALSFSASFSFHSPVGGRADRSGSCGARGGRGGDGCHTATSWAVGTGQWRDDPAPASWATYFHGNCHQPGHPAGRQDTDCEPHASDLMNKNSSFGKVWLFLTMCVWSFNSWAHKDTPYVHTQNIHENFQVSTQTFSGSIYVEMI